MLATIICSLFLGQRFATIEGGRFDQIWTREWRSHQGKRTTPKQIHPSQSQLFKSLRILSPANSLHNNKPSSFFALNVHWTITT
jgi:hypothetical protein